MFLICSVSRDLPAAEEKQVRDVFAPNIARPVPSASQGPAPQTITANLEGISIGAKGSFAVINGSVYYEGEEKSGIKVTQIRKREADILINNIPTTLYMITKEGSASSGEEPESPANVPSSLPPSGSEQMRRMLEERTEAK